MTVGEIIERYIYAHDCNDQHGYLACHLLPIGDFFLFLDIGQLPPQAVAMRLVATSPNLWEARRRFRLLRNCFAWARRRGLIEANPCDGRAAWLAGV